MTSNPQSVSPEKSGVPKKNRTLSILKTTAMLVLIGVCVLFITRQIAKGWGDLANYQWHFSLLPLLGSLGLLFVNFLLVAWAWKVVFTSLTQGEKVPLRRVFAIIFSAQLGRYIPGKIWVILGQVVLAEKMGYKKSYALTAGVIQYICGGIGALVVFALSLAGMGQPVWMVATCLVVALAVMILLVVSPAPVEKWVNVYRAKKQRDPVRLAVGKKAITAVFFIMILAWADHCVAFALLVRSIHPVSRPLFFELAFAYNLAYHVAFYMLLVPGGLGVREGTLTALITSSVGAGMAGVIALLQRVWYMIGEVLAFVAAIIIAKKEGAFVTKDRSEK